METTLLPPKVGIPYPTCEVYRKQFSTSQVILSRPHQITIQPITKTLNIKLIHKKTNNTQNQETEQKAKNLNFKQKGLSISPTKIKTPLPLTKQLAQIHRKKLQKFTKVANFKQIYS